MQKPCFTHGQLYVAFSRVPNYCAVKIFIENRNDQGTFKFRNRKIFTNDRHEDMVQRLERLRVIYNKESEEESDHIDPIATTISDITASMSNVTTTVVDKFLKSRVSVFDQPGTSGLKHK